jgi:Fur family zinc uptake transcriptional regulator
LICRGCRKVEELSDDSVHDLISRRAKASGFAAQRQIVEIVGMCADCAAKDARA